MERELLADVDKFAKEMGAHLPEPGAHSSVEFMTQRGYEQFSFDWSENRTLDASQKLTILEHVGGNPIFVLAGRGRWSPECYDAVAKWLGRAVYYGNLVATP